MMALSSQALIFIALAALSSTIYVLLTRYILRKTDPYAISLITNIAGAVVFLPFAANKISFPDTLLPYFVVGIAAIIWTAFSVSNFIAYKGVEVSIKQSLGQSKLIWILIFGIGFLGETVTLNRAIGTIIIAAGIFFLVWHPEKRFGRLSDPGVRWTFFAALLGAFVSTLDKAALRWFPLEFYGFLVYLFPALILLTFLPGRTHQVRHLMKLHWFAVTISVLVSATFYYFTLKVYSLVDITLAYPLLQFGVLITVLSGIIFFKEREHLWQKIVAAVIVVVGAIIIGR